MHAKPSRHQSGFRVDRDAMRLIVCERRGDWATALSPHLPADIRLCQTRSLGECLVELAAAPASLVAVELPAGSAFNVRSLENMLDWLDRVSHGFAWARLVVVTDPSAAPWEWLLREAGAAQVWHSTREACQLARLAVRHRHLLPPPQGSMTERLWAELPWSEQGNA